MSGQFFKSFLVANSLCGPGSPSHTFPSFPPRPKLVEIRFLAAFLARSSGALLHGAPLEQWSTPSSQICVRTCSLPVCNQFSKYPCTAAPGNLCLGEPPVITTVFSTKGCFKRTISLPIRHMPRTNWWPKSVFPLFFGRTFVQLHLLGYLKGCWVTFTLQRNLLNRSPTNVAIPSPDLIIIVSLLRVLLLY